MKLNDVFITRNIFLIPYLITALAQVEMTRRMIVISGVTRFVTHCSYPRSGMQTTPGGSRHGRKVGKGTVMMSSAPKLIVL